LIAFDFLATVKQIDPAIREQLFSAWPALKQLEWSAMRKKRSVEPLARAVQLLAADDKRSIHLLLRTCLGLKQACGLKVLLEELQEKHPDLVGVWGNITGRLDRVVWTYLNARDAFEEAVIFARADHLSMTRSWHRWTGVPYQDFVASDARIAALRQALISHHDGQLRGTHCEIHHYTRKNSAEYFFAYLPDWPDKFLVFNRSGELETLDLPTAFSILFVFLPATGALEMIAPGDQTTLATLRHAFYEVMTQTSVPEADPDRPAFELDHLLEDTFTFAAPGVVEVEAVGATRLLVCPRVDGHDIEGLQLRITRGTTWPRVLARLDAMLVSMDLIRQQVTVEEIWIKIKCVTEGDKRARTLPITITPRACNLKSQDEDDLRVIGERCLQAWRIDRG